MIGLGKEVPPLGQQACILHHEGRHQVQADASLHSRQQQQKRQRKHRQQENHFTPRSTATGWPWKNSRVLKLPPMKPWVFCAIFGCLMPIAVCSVDFGFQARIANQRGSATQQTQHGDDRRPAGQETDQFRRRRGGKGSGQREPGCTTEQDG